MIFPPLPSWSLKYPVSYDVHAVAPKKSRKRVKKRRAGFPIAEGCRRIELLKETRVLEPRAPKTAKESLGGLHG